jgi:rubrerythrin
MAKTATVATLFELAIAAERAAEALYRGLEKKFAHHQPAADFWDSYAKEEDRHAHWLERARDRLSAEQLSAPADPNVLQQANKALKFSVEHALKGIRNLEDAYQLTSELENAETNAIFEFLINNFTTDEQTTAFLRAQLKGHVGQIMIEFPTQFNSQARREIKAQDQ